MTRTLLKRLYLAFALVLLGLFIYEAFGFGSDNGFASAVFMLSTRARRYLEILAISLPVFIYLYTRLKPKSVE